MSIPATHCPEWDRIMADDPSAFIRRGRLLRVTPEPDTDCMRYTVEEHVGGGWRAIVVSSLNWQAELSPKFPLAAAA